MSGDWPEGLRLLLDNCSNISTYNGDGQRALRYAYNCLNLESIRILLETGYEINDDIWHMAVWSGEMERIQAIINEMVRRLPQPLASSIPYYRWRSLHLNDMYHVPDLAVDIANRLYLAGFHNMDLESSVWKPKLSRLLVLGTPLWQHSLELILKLDSHFLVGTTPAHVISSSLPHFFRQTLDSGADSIALDLEVPAKRLMDCTADVYSDAGGLLEFYRDIVCSTETDKCNCACSLFGCNVITCALKFNSWQSWIWERRGKSESLKTMLEEDPVFWAKVLDAILSLVEEPIRTVPGLAAAVLRVLTFEKIGLRHTCHGILFHAKILDKPTPCDEEIAEFHDEDRHLIEKLDRLMKLFEAKWCENDGTMKDFVYGYWTEKMGEVIGEMSIISKEQIRGIAALGVRLEEV
ncbi:hypothetical protein BCR34DRAFT_598542 [Clohesyomyces aquaticus]|uniref:Uncharacterized protein n=1 Tax=Clohesyomyces aquaticus TaxID=1231657 RepID=A0A1Y1ZYF9_9PLEO|nr:hypothetical protein BCR34DRAFT_598542 [Clohesyomyces aquaticus]